MIRQNITYLSIFLLFFPLLTHGEDSSSSDSLIPAGITIQAENYREEFPSDYFVQWISNKPRLEINPRFKSEIENIRECNLLEKPCPLIISLSFSMHTHKTDQSIIDSKSIENFVTDLARKIDKDPIDARFKVENDRVVEFASSQSGIKLNVSESVLILEDAAKKYSALSAEHATIVILPFDKVEPAIKDNAENGLGITALIGQGSSNFKGSPKNRIFNIKVATERFNGVLIKPGEEFSFVSILGEVDGEHGYLPELVIKNDRTEPEFGGGICQVSTTTFRAAIYSGLKITARRNHAYPVSYYNPQGMDATVYVPRPDLKFINNTPGYILIQTKIEGTVLTFQFYGTNDERKVEIDGPRITQRNPDGSMKAIFTQKVLTKDGTELINDVFNSSYASPSKYPHPGEAPKLTQKPKDWSDKEWATYKKANGM